jgi:uncharacterized protein (TIGR02001 family)
VDFNVDESIEIDLYAGFSKAWDNRLGFDVAVYRYTYPNSQPDGFDYSNSRKRLNILISRSFLPELFVKKMSLKTAS